LLCLFMGRTAFDYKLFVLAIPDSRIVSMA
jgi:hypothetical protein